MSTPDQIPTISVAILTHNRPENCLKLAESLSTMLDDLDGELFLINNGQAFSPEHKAELDRLRCRIVQMPENKGIAARNALLGVAQSQLLLFIDDDIELRRETLASLLTIARERPKTGVFGFRIVDSRGKEESCLLPTVFHGCACAFRKDVIYAAGGYPEDFGYYAEEYDIAFRIYKSGGRIDICCSAGSVVHHREQSGRNLSRILHYLIRNNCFLCFAHLPADHIMRAMLDVIRRYYLVSRKEKAFPGFIKGILSIPGAMARGLMQRDAFDEELFAGVSLTSSLRKTCAEIALSDAGRELVICGVGRFPSLWLKVIRESGLVIRCFWDSNPCWHSHSMGEVPVVIPDQYTMRAAVNSSVFLVGTCSAGENRLWASKLSTLSDAKVYTVNTDLATEI